MQNVRVHIVFDVHEAVGATAASHAAARAWMEGAVRDVEIECPRDRLAAEAEKLVRAQIDRFNAMPPTARRRIAPGIDEMFYGSVAVLGGLR